MQFHIVLFALLTVAAAIRVPESGFEAHEREARHFGVPHGGFRGFNDGYFAGYRQGYFAGFLAGRRSAVEGLGHGIYRGLPHGGVLRGGFAGGPLVVYNAGFGL